MLLHHHFKLDDDEFLTDVGGTATAWTSQKGSRPSIWSSDEHTIRPLEFAMEDDNYAVAYPDWDATHVQDFLAELRSTFVTEGIERYMDLGVTPETTILGVLR